MNKFKLGQTVLFKFGRQPATPEGMALAARRSSNMSEMQYLEKTKYQGEWIDLWTTATILGFSGQTYIVGDPANPDEAYSFVKESSLKEMS